MGSDTYRANELEVDILAAYLGVCFLSLVDLHNDICTAKGSLSLDDNVLSGELASDLVGELAAELVGELAGEPVGELAFTVARTLARSKLDFLTEESSIKTPCCTCSSPQSQLAVSSNITSLLIIAFPLMELYNL